MCGRRESNPYALRHQILSLACLPISTRPLIWDCKCTTISLICKLYSNVPIMRNTLRYECPTTWHQWGEACSVGFLSENYLISRYLCIAWKNGVSSMSSHSISVSAIKMLMASSQSPILVHINPLAFSAFAYQ